MVTIIIWSLFLKHWCLTRILFPLVLFCFIFQGDCLVILSPPPLANKTFDTPRDTVIGPRNWTFDVTGQLVFENTSDLKNKVVIVTDYQYVSLAANYYWAHGASAIVLSQLSSPLNIPGYLIIDWDGGNSSSIPLPSVIISLPDSITLQQYLSEGYNITVRVTSEDYNPWLEVPNSGALIFYSVFLGGFALTVIIIALVKFITLVRRNGCYLSLPHLILFFEMIGNAERLVAVTVDPLQFRLIFPLLVNQMLFTTSWPFTILTTMLVALYWHEIIHNTNIMVNAFLTKLKTPFWIIAAVLFVIEIVTSVLRGLSFDIKAEVIVVGVVYVAINTAAVIFFFVTGTKITKLLRKSDRLRSQKVRKLRKATAYIYISCLGIIIWIIATVLGGLTPILWIPWGYFSLWFIVFFILIFISLNQVLVVHIPKSKKLTPKTSDEKKNVTSTASLSTNKEETAQSPVKDESIEAEEQKENKGQKTSKQELIEFDKETKKSEDNIERNQRNDENEEEKKSDSSDSLHKLSSSSSASVTSKQ